MSVTNRQLPPWTIIAVIIIPLVVGGLNMIFREGLIVSFGYGLLGIAFITLLAKFILWEPLWVRLAFVKIEVQDSSIMGIYPPLPDNLIYGKMEPFKVQFKLSSWLKIQIDSVQLWSGATECSSKSFSRKNGNIFEAWFEIPVKWFKGKTRKAYIRVSIKGRQWCSQEFEIKVNN